MSKRLDLGLSGERVARGQRRPTEPFSVLSPLSPDDKFSRRLSNPDLRCKNKCGFYGNPIYQGYCSKCFKELIRDREEGQTKSLSADGVELEASATAFSGLGVFDKFNKKRKIAATAKGRGKRLIPGTPLKITPGVGPPQDKDSKKSKKSAQGNEPFTEFLKTLKKPAAQDIVQQLRQFKKQIISRTMSTVEEQSEAVQEFYQTIGERLKTHPLFHTMSGEQQENMMDGIEKHLMTNIYQRVFSPASCDDEMKDLLLQRRIRMLHWLEPHHLDIALNLENPEVQEMVSKGRQELWNMNNWKAPQDKLSCIQRCCMHLLAAIKLSQDVPASADEFLPSLIFLVFYTSPQHVHSNINYISRFSNPVRLMGGEAGYYYTNLCGAVHFIENVSAENLQVDEEEFNTKMGYVDGKTDADLLIEEDPFEEDEERILILKSCCQGMKELTDQLQQMVEEARDLDGKIREFRTGLRQQVDSILSAPPPRSLLPKHMTQELEEERLRKEQEAVGATAAGTLV